MEQPACWEAATGRQAAMEQLELQEAAMGRQAAMEQLMYHMIRQRILRREERHGHRVPAVWKLRKSRYLY